MRPALTPLPPSATWGGSEIRSGDPGIGVQEDVVALPYAEDGAWGVYDPAGALVSDAADRRLPHGELLQPARAEAAAITGAAPAAEAEYLYGGRLHGQYGHHVIEGLARLWPLTRGRWSGAKLLFHSHLDKTTLFSQSFTAATLGALGLGPDDVALVDRPMAIRRLVTPRPAIQQQAFAYACFRDLCLEIGARVRGERLDRGPLGALKRTLADGRSDTPLYVSKRWLTSGVRRIENDGEIEGVLHAAGFNILYPELVPFAEQLGHFAARKVIVGTVGSALHSVIFGRPPTRLLAISPDPQVNANFRLIDQLSGARTEYLLAEAGCTPLGPGGAFGSSYRFERPREVAAEILRRL